jgi:hypothetical protein
VARGVLGHAELANELDVDAGLLLYLANRRFRDALALLDASSGNDCRELGQLRDVEDEQLVGARLGVLAGDVGGDRRAGSQLFWARIFAL